MNDKTVSYTFRIPVSLKEQLIKQANNEDRTLSNLIIKILKEGVSNEKNL